MQIMCQNIVFDGFCLINFWTSREDLGNDSFEQHYEKCRTQFFVLDSNILFMSSDIVRVQ